MKDIIELAFNTITHIAMFFGGVLFGFVVGQAGMTFLFGMITGGFAIALIIGLMAEDIHRKEKIRDHTSS